MAKPHEVAPTTYAEALETLEQKLGEALRRPGCSVVIGIYTAQLLLAGPTGGKDVPPPA